MGPAKDRSHYYLIIYYVVDVTSCFAKRIIRNNLPNNEETKEYVWCILKAGLMNLLK